MTDASQNKYYQGEIRVGGRILTPGRPALLTAEIGGNHGGDPELAGRMVRAAAESGAGAVKFQAYRTEAFLSPLNPYYNELAAEELAFTDLAVLADQAHRLGLACGLTVFDWSGLDLARDCRADYLKISSGDLTNPPLLELAARAGLPLFVSTGAAEAAEVDQALAALAPAEEVLLMQCASLYPAPPEAANLEVMAGWLAAGRAAGYSDHCLGLEAAGAALALGALALEKHFTIDRALPGGDNEISATPEEMAQLARWAELAPILRGSGLKAPHQLEAPMRPLIRRAVVAASDLLAGQTLTADDLSLLRPPPGPGLLEPKELPGLVGRILKRPLARGAALTRADLEEADG